MVQWTTLYQVPSESLVTVVETPEFIRRIDKLMDDEERAALILYLAENPTAGDLIPGTGGVRKLRWGLEGRGKRGGARIIHFFHSSRLPLFLVTAFAKVANNASAAPLARLHAVWGLTQLGRKNPKLAPLLAT